MIAFDIVDGRYRAARPCGRLMWDAADESWRIHIAEDAQPADVPFLLALALKRGEREIGMPWAARWVEERLVPAGRQNLGEILRAHGLREYDAVALLAEGRGACSHDDFVLRGPYDPETRESAPDAREALRLSVGNAITQCRKRQGLTQTQLAERAAVDQAIVSRIERGRANPTLDLIADLATALGVEPKMILETSQGGE